MIAATPNGPFWFVVSFPFAIVIGGVANSALIVRVSRCHLHRFIHECANDSHQLSLGCPRFDWFSSNYGIGAAPNNRGTSVSASVTINPMPMMFSHQPALHICATVT